MEVGAGSCCNSSAPSLKNLRQMGEYLTRQGKRLEGIGDDCRVSADTSMDTNTPSGQLAALSFLVFWGLLAILVFSGVRSGLNAEPSDDDQSQGGDRSSGRIARYLNENNRALRVAGLAVEAKASSYFARRIGKIHLGALAFFAVTTLFLTLWNLHEAKLKRLSDIETLSPPQRVQMIDLAAIAA